MLRPLANFVLFPPPRALDLCSYPMSVMLVASGLSAALSGKWAMRVGVNRAMTVGGAIYGSGLALSGVGVGLHSLPLLYAGNSKYIEFSIYR